MYLKIVFLFQTNATVIKIVQSPNPKVSTSKKRTPSRKSITSTQSNLPTKKPGTQSKKQKCSQLISSEALPSETTSSTPEIKQQNSTVLVHLTIKQETIEEENCPQAPTSQYQTSPPEIKEQYSTDTDNITIKQETRLKEENCSQPFKKENCDTLYISIKQETEVKAKNSPAALEHQTISSTPKLKQQNSIDTANTKITQETRTKEDSSPQLTSSENQTTLSIPKKRKCNDAPKLPILKPKPVQEKYSYFEVQPLLSFHPENHPISITTKKLKTGDPVPSPQFDSVTQNSLCRRILQLSGKLNQKNKQLKVLRDQLRYYKKKVISQNVIINELRCKSNINEKDSDIENKIGGNLGTDLDADQRNLDVST